MLAVAQKLTRTPIVNFRQALQGMSNEKLLLLVFIGFSLVKAWQDFGPKTRVVPLFTESYVAVYGRDSCANIQRMVKNCSKHTLIIIILMLTIKWLLISYIAACDKHLYQPSVITCQWLMSMVICQCDLNLAKYGSSYNS